MQRRNFFLKSIGSQKSKLFEWLCYFFSSDRHFSTSFFLAKPGTSSILNRFLVCSSPQCFRCFSNGDTRGIQQISLRVLIVKPIHTEGSNRSLVWFNVLECWTW